MTERAKSCSCKNHTVAVCSIRVRKKQYAKKEYGKRNMVKSVTGIGIGDWFADEQKI